MLFWSSLSNTDEMIRMIISKNVVDRTDSNFIQRLVEAGVTFEKIKYGLPMAAISLRERCVLFERLVGTNLFTQRHAKLICPSLEIPENFLSAELRETKELYYRLYGVEGSVDPIHRMVPSRPSECNAGLA